MYYVYNNFFTYFTFKVKCIIEHLFEHRISIWGSHFFRVSLNTKKYTLRKLHFLWCFFQLIVIYVVQHWMNIEITNYLLYIWFMISWFFSNFFQTTISTEQKKSHIHGWKFKYCSWNNFIHIMILLNPQSFISCSTS